jgi:hypothetical protein
MRRQAIFRWARMLQATGSARQRSPTVKTSRLALGGWEAATVAEMQRPSYLGPQGHRADSRGQVLDPEAARSGTGSPGPDAPDSGGQRAAQEDALATPNLFIIGAMKSGTTSLHQYLARHPDAFMCEPKEPGFFVEELRGANGLDWYLSLFRDAGDARIVGESSTHYTKLPTYQGTPERIHHFNRSARLVYLMRDPLERTVSHYWHNVRTLHLEAEHRPFERAVREEPAYLAYSDYAMQLEPYLALFGRDRLFTVTFEALAADPREVVTALCRWLGLDDGVPPEAFQRRWNVRPEVFVKASGKGVLNRLRHSSWWGRVAGLVPKRARRLGRRLAVETVTPDAGEIQRVLDRLRPRMQERTQALAELLGRTFPEWTTLHGHD